MFNRFKSTNALACLIICSVSAPVMATDVSLGVVGFWQSSPYKGHDDIILPAPLVYFEGERFYIHGMDAGIHIWTSYHQAVSFGITYSMQQFHSSKTDDSQLKKLNNRHSTVNAYLQYTVQTDYGHISLSVLHDTFGNSNAFSAKAYYKSPFVLGSVYVSPGAGVYWDSKKQTEYYFGISVSESHKSGLNRYSANNAISPFLSLEVDWRFTSNWSVTAAGRVLFLSKKIQDSPMVDNNQVFNAIVGIKYAF